MVVIGDENPGDTMSGTSTATTDTADQRYWLGILGREISYSIDASEFGPAETQRELLLIPSTPTSRRRAERIRLELERVFLEARARDVDPERDYDAIARVLIELPRIVGRVRTARQLAATFGLDLRYSTFLGGEKAALSPLGLNTDFPTLRVPWACTDEELVEHLAWGVGAMVTHWLGMRQWIPGVLQIEHEIGRVLLVRDDDVDRLVIRAAWWPFEEAVDGTITEESFSAFAGDQRRLAAEMAAKDPGRLTAKLVSERANDFDTYGHAKEALRSVLASAA